MKKMLIALLSLGMVLSGCVQNEYPEEPPVVEDETEKQPTINEDIIIDVETDSDEEDNEKDDESNLGNEIIEDPNDNEQNVNENIYKNENISEDQGKWVFIEEEYIDKRSENKEKRMIIYSNGDEF